MKVEAGQRVGANFGVSTLGFEAARKSPLDAARSNHRALSANTALQVPALALLK
jgi:hypothetical protein